MDGRSGKFAQFYNSMWRATIKQLPTSPNAFVSNLLAGSNALMTKKNKDASGKPTDDVRLQAAEAAELDAELLEDDGEGRFLLFNVVPSWMFSFVAHVALILLMAFLVMPRIEDKSVAFEASESVSEQIETIELNLDADLDLQEDALESEVNDEVVEVMDVTPEMEVDVTEEVFLEVDMAAEIFETAEAFSDSSEIGAPNEVVSRSSEESRERLLKDYGGSSASEEAVALALQWLVKHQLPDGGWCFDHRIGGEKFRDSPNAGELIEARAGATALALLPLLGQGHTHLAGKYKKEVRAGLEYLIQRGQPQRGGSISYLEPGGSMYSHGLVSIVFGEAFAMSQDPLLAPYAQGCIWYMEQAQDPVGGGWRYKPRQPGDTSAVGWQVMALKSAKLSGIQINKQTFRLIDKFLKNVSIDNGTFYGYSSPPPNRNRTRTAVGLLCRMYMGWEKDHPSLVKGIDFVSKAGPLQSGKVDIYYDYYGTQLMKQYGGEKWTKWNKVMRDALVETQSKRGNSAGSWFFPNDNHAEKGGRLYHTAMACMTLEVYYRYLPLYSQEATEDDFPLD